MPTFRKGSGQFYNLPEAPPLIRPSGIADLTLESATRRHVLFVLEYTEGELQWAAEELGVKTSTLYRWRQRMEAGRPVHMKLMDKRRDHKEVKREEVSAV